MFILSDEIREYSKRLQITTYAFRDALAETLTTHPRSVEIHFPISMTNGFKMKFTVFSSKLTPFEIYERLTRDAQSINAKIEPELPKKIKKVWNLKKSVRIPIDRIEVDGVEPDTMSQNQLFPNKTIQELQKEKSKNKKKKKKKNNKYSEIEMNVFNQQQLSEGNIPYNEHTFAANFAHITNSNIPGMVNFDSNTKGKGDNDKSDDNGGYDAKMNALNAQIAMNQYLMMQQMEEMKQREKLNDNQLNEMEKMMKQQMELMNSMINNGQKYDVDKFQEFNNHWINIQNQQKEQQEKQKKKKQSNKNNNNDEDNQSDYQIIDE